MIVEEDMFIFDEIIRMKTLCLVHGKEGIGKSRFCLSLARRVAEKYPVLYCDSETPISLLKKRIMDIGSHPWLSFQLGAMTLEEMQVAVAEYGEPILLIIDNFSSNFVGVDQNDLVAVAKIVRPLAELAMSCCIILIHHNNKTGIVHGSVEFLRVANLVINLRASTFMVAKSNYETPRRGDAFEWDITNGDLNVTPIIDVTNYEDTEKIREQNRERQKRYRERQKALKLS